MRVGAAVAAAIMLGLAVLGLVGPVSAETENAVNEVVAAVAALPELSVLSPEESDRLQADLQAALAAAVESDAAAGIVRELPVDDIVAAVQSAASEGDELNIDQLVAAALEAYSAL